ncbi:MAG: HYR domain-containing protein, partial [Verrucomicrobia bacterium]|nr:HYR domain-containing protein [Verrucomicrobiota bacterium]
MKTISKKAEVISQGWLFSFLTFLTLLAAVHPVGAQLEDTWSIKANNPIPREGVGVAAVGTKVYVIGGYNFGDRNVNTVFDTVTGTWTTNLAPMPTSRSELIAVSDGRYVYCIGGRATIAAMERYDPATDTWTILRSLPTGRGGLGAAVVGDKIYVIGGRQGGAPFSGAPLNTVEIYDIATDTWSTGAPMPTARGDVYSVAAIGTKIYVAGGNLGFFSSTSLDVLEIYDTVSNTWTTGPSMPTARSNATAASCGGKFHVIGGLNQMFSSPFSTNEAFDPVSGTWATEASMPTPRSELGSAVIGNVIYVEGGGFFGSAFGGHANEAYVCPLPNQPPTLTCPATLTAECGSISGTSIPITAHVTDPDGDPLTVTWKVGSFVFSNEANTTTPVGAADMPFADLKLWLKADAGVSKDSSNNLSKWLDQSGNGNDAKPQTAGPFFGGNIHWADNVLNGKPVVRFDAFFGPFLQAPSIISGTGGRTVFTVTRPQSSSFSFFIPPILNLNISGFSPGTGYSVTSEVAVRTSPSFFGGGGFKLFDSPLSTQAFSLLTVQSAANSDVTDTHAWINGQERGALSQSSAAINTGTGNTGIGGDSFFGGFLGDIAEALVYNRAVTPAERQAIESYLNLKYFTPVVPSQLTVTALSSTQAYLQWSNIPSDSSGFKIERKAGVSGAFQTIASVGPGAGSFIDTGLVANTQYFYRLQMTNLDSIQPSQVDSVPAGGPPTSADVTFTHVYLPGEYIVRVTASDGRAVVNCSTLLTVTAGGAAGFPPILKFKNVTVNVDPGKLTAAVAPSLLDNGTTDPGGFPMTFTLTPAGPFPVGVNQVRFTATNTQGLSNTGIATITVKQQTGPSIVSPADVTVKTDPGQNYASNVQLGFPSVSDQAGIASLTNDAPAKFPKGDTTVTWTAVNLSGQKATSTQIVHVIDTEPPVLICPPPVIVKADAGTEFATGVNLGTPLTSDNVGILSVTNNAPVKIPFGVNSVTWIAKDTSTNTTTCAQTVVVRDNVPPAVTCSAASGSLWPPNHQMVDVGFALNVKDDHDPSPKVNIAVYSDEPDESPTGDGNASPDASIAPPKVFLRSERKGDSDGRVYLIVTTATDNEGNVGRCCSTVVVPHSQSKADIDSVNAQAATAKSTCESTGTPPTGFFLIAGGISTLPSSTTTVSITSPADNTTFGAGAPIPINATATTSSGSITKVEFFQGFTKIGEDTSAPYSITWTGATGGDYTLTAIATTSSGEQAASAPVTIHVQQFPVVTWVTPVTGTIYTLGQTVNLAAEAYKIDGTISKVEFFDLPPNGGGGTTKLGEATAYPYTFAWVGATPGSHTLTAKATDRSGFAATSGAATIQVLQPPVVTLTSPAADHLVFPPDSNITLTAVAQDADGTVAKVEFFAGAAKVGEVTSSPYTVTMSNVAAGTYFLYARATDNDGNVTTSAPVTVRVDVPPSISISYPTEGSVAPAGGLVNIGVSATDTDGQVVKVEYFSGQSPPGEGDNGSTKIGESTKVPFSFAWIGVAPGSHTITAKATDNDGVATTSSAITFSENAAPLVSLTQPADNSVVQSGATVTLAANATSANATITHVDFYQGATRVCGVENPPYSHTVVGLAAGSYVFTAKAFDNLGASSTSAPVHLRVNAPPTISIASPASNSLFLTGSDIVLAVNVSDSDGAVAKVEYFNGSTKLGESITPPFAFRFAQAPRGDYLVTARATDSDGATAVSNPIVIRVGDPLSVTLTSPVSGESFQPGQTIRLEAAIADPRNSVAKVEFFDGTTKLGEDATAPFSFDWTNAAAGAHSLTARATAGSGFVAVSPPVSIRVNLLPEIVLTSPADQSIHRAGDPINLAAIATDPDGFVTRVEFHAQPPRAGMKLWLKADEGVITDASNRVSQWRDASNNGNHAVQSAAAQQPTRVDNAVNNKPVVRFDGNDVLRTNPFSSVISQPDTIFVVVKSSAAQSYVFDGLTNGGNRQAFGRSLCTGTGENCLYAGSFITYQEASPSQYNLFSLTLNGANSSIYRNGVLQVTGNVGNNSLDGLTLGKVNDGQGDLAFLNGDIAEIIVYERALPGTERRTVESYLSSKYFNAGSTKIGEASTIPFSFNWTGVASGNYLLVARAFDNDNASTDSAPVSILVNAPPTVSLDASTTGDFTPGTPITLTATATDSDGTVAKVEFFDGAQKVGEDTTAPYTHIFSSATQGAHVFTAVATDNLGFSSTSNTVTITINVVNAVPPTVSVTAPADNSNFLFGDAITITATAADTDGTVAKIEFYDNAQKIGEDLTAPYSFIWNDAALGAHNIQAVATDNSGASAVSAPVRVSVSEPANLLPAVAITIPLGGTAFAFGDAISITAAASDSDGTIMKVEFFADNIKIGEDLTPPFSFLTSHLAAGPHILVAAATDNRGALVTSAPVSISISVPPANAPPTVSLTASITGDFIPGTPIDLTATAADTDGTITKVEFFDGAQKVGEDTTAPYTHTFSSATQGTHAFTAVATDNRGATGVSNAVIISINVSSAVPPTVSITAPAANAA